MDFEVNGEQYFLALLPENGDLALFSPTDQGLRRLPILSDKGPMELFAVQNEDEGGEGNAILN